MRSNRRVEVQLFKIVHILHVGVFSAANEDPEVQLHDVSTPPVWKRAPLPLSTDQVAAVETNSATGKGRHALHVLTQMGIGTRSKHETGA